MRDPTWARRQRASELAVLANHIGDRLFALLVAFEQGRKRDADER
jgi:hypothetical protein